MRITTTFLVPPSKLRRTPDDVLSGVLAALEAEGVPVVEASAKPDGHRVLVSVTTNADNTHGALERVAVAAVAGAP